MPLTDELDKTIASFGLIFALALTIWLALVIGRPIYVAVGVLSFLAFAGYLIIRKSLSPSTLPSLDLAEIPPRLYYLLNVVFFTLFVYSILCVYLRSDPYVRPLGYFVSVALMVSVMAIEILFLPSSKRCNYFALFKIVLVGLSLEFSQILIYPSLVGIDPWWHQVFTSEILNVGHIPEGYYYSNLPLMHLEIGSTSLLTGLNYKMAAMLSVSLSQVLCNVLFTFLLGRFLFNKKVGSLGSLLLVVANWHVNMGYWVIPNTMASLFVPAVIYLLLKVRRGASHVSTVVTMLLMGALILTHSLTAAFMALVLFISWLGFKVYNYLYHEWKTPITLTISTLFAVGMFSWWAYASGYLTTLADLIRSGFSVNYFLKSMVPEVIHYASNVPFSEQLLSYLGIFLFFAISFVGCLYMISRRFGNSYSFVIAIVGIATLSVAFFSLITGRSIIEHRWWYFSQVLLALPLAIALFLLCSAVKNRLGRTLLLVALTFSLSFFMVVSLPANMDNPTLLQNTQVRYAFFGSELQAMKRAASIWSKDIGVDAQYSELRWSSYLAQDISTQIYDKNYTECLGMFVLIRKEIVLHPFKLGEYTYKLDYDPNDALTAQIFSRVYDCGSVSGFINTENLVNAT